ncbi:hypothetical protein UA08_06097 [Talaromyces atroroseus]|uniref:Protein DSF2 n=1 Tax=Talaromyces atroroseus TaxID=1441469 RepID=A0A225AYN0_TALAT|nr:hypothetical protein UA08_06097 [Talaromyces atroroseus]OKL58607.1 hypothetical protein UA08_06097 [Talaromyces atroroseus]
MPLKDILHRHRESIDPPASPQEIRFIRTDTHSQELLSPAVADDEQEPQTPLRRSFFRRRSHASSADAQSPRDEKGESRHFNFFHHHRSHSRSSSPSSANIPSDLPQIEDGRGGDEQDRQAQWENRATRLVQGNPRLGASPDRTRPSTKAIRLHESGELEKSTHLFGVLADPEGANNALAQVLFGLALRHGWGCEPDLSKAVIYLAAAASNSAMIEEEALHAGMKKGGAAKGELVLAIYELANCFRNGWGTEKDPVAARQYYETAANLGDTDAMNECAWCYLEGFGGKKDKVTSHQRLYRVAFHLLTLSSPPPKFTAAKYYRLAEENGNKTLGNTWGTFGMPSKNSYDGAFVKVQLRSRGVEQITVRAYEETSRPSSDIDLAINAGLQQDEALYAIPYT